MPLVPQVQVTREQLKGAYLDLLVQNPLLARIETQAKVISWTTEEIRTLQLLVACRSNASLTERICEMKKQSFVVPPTELRR